MTTLPRLKFSGACPHDQLHVWRGLSPRRLAGPVPTETLINRSKPMICRYFPFGILGLSPEPPRASSGPVPRVPSGSCPHCPQGLSPRPPVPRTLRACPHCPSHATVFLVPRSQAIQHTIFESALHHRKATGSPTGRPNKFSSYSFSQKSVTLEDCSD